MAGSLFSAMLAYSILLGWMVTIISASVITTHKLHDRAPRYGYSMTRLQRRSLHKRGIRVRTGAFEPFSAPSGLQGIGRFLLVCITQLTQTVSKYQLELAPVPGIPKSMRYVDILGDSPVADKVAPHLDDIYNRGEAVYMTDITFGNQTLISVVDTGSADTWVVQQQFVCLNHSSAKKEKVDQVFCKFGKPYTQTKTFKAINDQHYNISYIDGEFLNGPMGTESITLGGVTVENQEFGLINYAAWAGDSYSSGLTGLAFPSVTRAYPGTDPKKDIKGLSYRYDPLLTNMIKKKLISPVFSIALNRWSEGPGALGLGGLPGPAIKHTNDWITTKMQYLHFSQDSNDPKKPNDYQFYVVEVEGWDLPRPMFTSEGVDLSTVKQKIILDTGSTLTQLPASFATTINGGKAWSPPAWKNNETDQWMVDCKAKPPKVGMKFGNKTLYYAREDMIFQGAQGICVSGIQPGNSSIAGGSFLKNVVAVFDVGAAQVRLAQRVR
jgi:Eukaryotic aspartyl protease